MMRKLSVSMIGLLVLAMSCSIFPVAYAATSVQEAESITNNASKLVTAGKIDEAAVEFNKAKTLDPKNANAYWGLAACSSAKGKVDEALSLLNQAIELDPTVPGFYDNRAVMYKAKGEYARAWADIQVAEKLGLKSNPGFVKELQSARTETSNESFTKAMKLIQDKRYEKALPLLNKAIANNPAQGTFYDSRAVVYNSLGQYGKARADVNTASKLGYQSNPAFVLGLQGAADRVSNESFAKAMKAMKAKKYEDALLLLNQAIENAPSQAAFYDSRAVVYNSLGQYAKALADVNTAKKLGFKSNPDFVKALEKALPPATKQ